MQRFEFLRQPLLGELAMSRKKEREKEKKMPFVVATYVYASSQGQRTHSARSKSQSWNIFNHQLMILIQGVCSMGYLTKYHCMYVCCQTQPSAVGDTYQHLPIQEDGYVMLQIILSKLETSFDIDQLGVSLSLSFPHTHHKLLNYFQSSWSTFCMHWLYDLNNHFIESCIDNMQDT